MIEQQSYREFARTVRGRRKGTSNKVNNCYGCYDIYKSIRKNHWYNIGRPLKEGEFYTIIRSVNDLLAEELANGRTVTLPYRMGKLELRKIKVGAFIKDDKLKITYPVDWDQTLKLCALGFLHGIILSAIFRSQRSQSLQLRTG